MTYKILNNDDLSTYETINPVFENNPIKLDEEGNLISSYLNKDNGRGLCLGLENKANKEFNLKLKITGGYCTDIEFNGKEEFYFKILAKSKKIFNIRVKPDENVNFNFDYKK